MKDIKDQQQFQAALQEKDRVCALFYASWCPFSRRFLPEFDAAVGKNAGEFSSVRIDDIDDLCDDYDIRVFPSVIFFEKGKVLARLDGSLGRGLSGSQLAGLIDKCNARRTDR